MEHCAAANLVYRKRLLPVQATTGQLNLKLAPTYLRYRWIRLPGVVPPAAEEQAASVESLVDERNCVLAADVERLHIGARNALRTESSPQKRDPRIRRLIPLGEDTCGCSSGGTICELDRAHTRARLSPLAGTQICEGLRRDIQDS